MLVDQAPTAVMMVRPDYFGYNQETAASNSFQQTDGKENLKEIAAKAATEFDGWSLALKTTGIEVIEFSSVDREDTPDAIFPNNWVSFHSDGKVIIYPMMAPSRRWERNLDFITALEKMHLFEVSEIIDISYYEEEGEYLEGTGSLVLDYVNKIVYANNSPRTSSMLVKKVADLLGYEVCQFRAVDDAGEDIYHTNVLMGVAGSFAIVCLDALKTPDHRNRLVRSLSESGHDLIEISREQMNRFAGNAIELRNDKGKSVLAMSRNAYDSLTPLQIQTIEKHSTILSAPIDTIEKYGGGSVRCMMAGVYLPRKPSGTWEQ